MERKIENKAVLVFNLDEIKRMIEQTYGISVQSLHNVYVNEAKDKESLADLKLTIICSEIKEDTVSPKPLVRQHRHPDAPIGQY